MKYFWIPVALLSALLALSLWNAREVAAAVEPWSDALVRAQDAAERGDWDEARRLVRETREAWQARHPYFHIVTAHDELDQADALFAQAEAYAWEQERSDLRAALAALRAQLRVVSEMQQLTTKNVL